MNALKNQSAGFTGVEMLVTIFVAAAFALVFFQLFTTVGTVTTAARQRSQASDLAYSYLRRYASGSKPTWFTCDTSGSSTANTNDRTINPNAPGQVIITGTTTEVSSLPNPVIYSVRAIAPYGCSGPNAGTPLRVEATIVYGSAAASISHATYVGY
jgi:type II secretory pathway pseudopilin PulG